MSDIGHVITKRVSCVQNFTNLTTYTHIYMSKRTYTTCLISIIFKILLQVEYVSAKTGVVATNQEASKISNAVLSTTLLYYVKMFPF